MDGEYETTTMFKLGFPKYRNVMRIQNNRCHYIKYMRMFFFNPYMVKKQIVPCSEWDCIRTGITEKIAGRGIITTAFPIPHDVSV